MIRIPRRHETQHLPCSEFDIHDIKSCFCHTLSPDLLRREGKLCKTEYNDIACSNGIKSLFFKKSQTQAHTQKQLCRDWTMFNNLHKTSWIFIWVRELLWHLGQWGPSNAFWMMLLSAPPLGFLRVLHLPLSGVSHVVTTYKVITS